MVTYIKIVLSDYQEINNFARLFYLSETALNFKFL